MRTLAALVLAVLAPLAACGDGDPEPATTLPDTAAAARPTTPLKALAESQSLEIRTALRNLNAALLDFHVLNDRYPRDAAELEANPATAAAFSAVRDVSDSLRYATADGGYRLVVHVRGAAPLTMEAPAPTLQPETP